MIISKAPGYYELVYDPSSIGAGPLLAGMIAANFENVMWIASPACSDDLFMLSEWIYWGDTDFRMVELETIAVTFAFGKECQDTADLIVIDDLASLRPDHPQGLHIDKSLRRSVGGWQPTVPVLVLNQWRNPCPPGGLYWRQVSNSRRLYPVIQNDDLHVAFLDVGNPPLFLIVCPDPDCGPEFRTLEKEEYEQWEEAFSFVQLPDRRHADNWIVRKE